MNIAHTVSASTDAAVGSPLPMVLIAIAVTAVVVSGAVALLMRTHFHRQAEKTQRALQADVVAREAAAAESHTRLEQREAMSIQALEAERNARNQDVNALLSRLSHGMKWEQTSREIIRREAAMLGMEGALATNVFLFTSDEAGTPFVTQIDHLVITQQALVLIEAKHWQGVVFDDVDPKSLHPALAPLSEGIRLPASFAIQLRREKDKPLAADVRSSPRLQARSQAAHLSKALKASQPDVPWIQTCVLYSHPDVRLFAAKSDGSGGRVQTPAVDAASLGAFLRKALHRPATTKIDVQALTDSLAPHAADVVGLGRMSDTWPDFFRSAGGRATE